MSIATVADDATMNTALNSVGVSSLLTQEDWLGPLTATASAECRGHHSQAGDQKEARDCARAKGPKEMVGLTGRRTTRGRR